MDFAWAVQPVDVLVMSAGVVRMGLTEDLKVEHVQEEINTNLLGSILPVQELLPRMKARVVGGAETGAIVFLSSLSALVRGRGRTGTVEFVLIMDSLNARYEYYTLILVTPVSWFTLPTTFYQGHLLIEGICFLRYLASKPVVILVYIGTTVCCGRV